MKRKRLIAAIIAFVLLSVWCVFANICSASDVVGSWCPSYPDGKHNYSYTVTKLENAHPHKAAFSCECGASIYKDMMYDAECEQCRREMCKGGLHFYKYHVWEDNDCYFGECYCGRLMVLDNHNDFKSHFNKHIPEKKYDDECMVCMWEQTYYEDLVYFYNVDTIYYQEEFTEAEISDDVYVYYDSCQAYDNCQKRAVNTSSSKKCKAHNFENRSSRANRHPHAGYFECDCGARINFTKSYMEECTECQKELCTLGIHCYAANMIYDAGSNYNGYGVCYCGKTQYFKALNDYAKDEEIYPGIMGEPGDCCEIKHPHREYNESTGRFYPYDEDEGSGWHVGACAGCQFESDYSDAISKYELNLIVYGTNTTNNVYTDSKPTNSYNEGFIFDDYDSWYDDYDYEEYDYEEEYEDEEVSDDELYEWLEQMKELINE